MVHQPFFSQRALRGFTLIELLVTFALFTTIITIATGALFSAQAINVRLEQTQTIFDGVHLSLETMSRDIRYGTDFYCDTTVPAVVPLVRHDCSYADGGGTVLIFKPTATLSSSDRVAYYIQDGGLYKNEYSNSILVDTYRITPVDAVIDSLAFYVRGAQSSSGLQDVANAVDYEQPLITVSLSGATNPTRPNTPPVRFSVQTSVSTRGVDK